VERGRQFFSSPADGIDMQAREPGDEPIPTVAELGTLDGGIPAPLLLIEPTEQQIHLLVDLPIGMVFLAKAVGARVRSQKAATGPERLVTMCCRR
jgi:hypothetical protein